MALRKSAPRSFTGKYPTRRKFDPRVGERLTTTFSPFSGPYTTVWKSTPEISRPNARARSEVSRFLVRQLPALPTTTYGDFTPRLDKRSAASAGLRRG